MMRRRIKIGISIVLAVISLSMLFTWGSKGNPKQASQQQISSQLSADERMKAERNFLEGQKCLIEGDWTKAVESFSKAIEINPQHVNYCYRGYSHYRNGEYNSAIADFRKSIDINANYLPAQYDLARALYLKGEINEAAAAYDNVDLSSPGASVASETDMFGLFPKDKAIDRHTQAIENNARDAIAYWQRGNVRYHQGEKDKAIADYSRAIEINPSFRSVYLIRAISRFDLGDIQGAISDATAANKLDPSCVGMLLNRGCFQYKAGDFQKAEADWSAAIKLNPSYKDPILSRATVRYEHGSLEDALQDFTKHGLLSPSGVPALYLPEDLQWNEYEKRLRRCNQAIAANPKDVIAHHTRAFLIGHIEGREAAIKAATKTIAIDPDFAFAYLYRGLANKELGELKSAIGDFHKVVRLFPEYQYGWTSRASIYRRLGNYEAAIKDYTTAIKLNPDDASLYQQRGEVRQESGYFRAAIKDFNRAIDLDPLNSTAYYSRGICQRELEKPDQAIVSFSMALNSNGTPKMEHLERGKLLLAQGDEKAARADFIRYVELQENDSNRHQAERYVMSLLGIEVEDDRHSRTPQFVRQRCTRCNGLGYHRQFGQRMGDLAAQLRNRCWHCNGRGYKEERY